MKQVKVILKGMIGCSRMYFLRKYNHFCYTCTDFNHTEMQY